MIIGTTGVWSISPDDSAAVVRRRRVEHIGKLDGGGCGDASAEAVADNADLAGLACDRACSGDVGDDLVEVERAHGDAAADLDVFRRVAELDAGPFAVEDGRGDGEVAGRRVAIGNRTDVVVDAEDLLHDDDATVGWTLRFGAVGGELEAVGCCQ